MDARLDTLSTELYQVNIHDGRIARWQETMGDFAPEASPPYPLVASDSDSENEDDDDGDDDDASDNDDGDVSSTDEMSTWHWREGGVVLVYDSSHIYGES